MAPKPTDSELIEILEATFAAELRNAPRQHRDMTPACPPLSRFATAAKSGWTTEEGAHRANCRYCQLTWSGVCKGLNEPLESVVEVAAEPAPQLRRYRALPSFSPAAGGACSSQTRREVVIELDGGFRVRLIPKQGQPELTTLHFDKPRRPTSAVCVFVADQLIELLQPIDEFGYTTVRTSDIQAVLSGQAELELDDADPQTAV